MKRVARLRPVLDLLVKAEEQARQRLAACEAQRVARLQQLADLRRYADEYRRRTQAGTVAVVALRDHQHFVARLEAMALVQERAVNEAGEACAQAAQELQRRQRRAEGFKRLLARYQLTAQAAADRSEQNALDDWSSSRRKVI